MSEIDRKSAGFSFLSSSFSEQDNLLLSTTPGSVAAAISSALETAAEDHTIPVSENQHFYNNFHYQQHPSSYNNNNDPFGNFGESVKPSLVNHCSNSASALHHHQQQQPQHSPVLFPVAPLRHDRFVECNNVINSNDPYNNQLLLTTCNSAGGGIVDRSSNKSILNSVSVAGNHVSGDQHFRSSSACSQFHHHQISATSASSFSSSSSQMADKQEYSSGDSFGTHNTSSVRDKSDNRETYQVSHCKEKPTSDNREVDSGGGGGCRVFKPSSKVIDLPEKSTSSSAALSHDQRQLHSSHHHHHHHHHHSRSKDSRIPVGIAVAWQRLVTTSSTNPSTTSTMTTKAEISSGSHPQNKSKMTSVSGSLLSPAATKHPSRPSSASPLKNAGRLSSSPALYPSSNNNNGYAGSNPNLPGCVDSNSDILSSITNHTTRPMSACGDAITGGSSGTHVSLCPSPASPTLSRPLPSSSVPPNIGYPTGYSSQYPPHPYHHRTAASPYLDSYSYAAAAAAAARPFAVPSPLSSPHHHSSHPNLLASNGHPFWGLESSHQPHPSVPLLSPGIPTSPTTPSDYLQQLSLQQQQQMQLPHHHFHQQQLLSANKQMSASPAPPSTTSSCTTPYSPYLPFLYPQDTTSASLAAVAAAAASMNKGAYYEHYFHQQQQQQMLAQNTATYLQQSHPNSIPTPPASGNNVGNTNSANGAVNNTNGNNNRSVGNSNSSIGGGTSGAANSNTHRAIPMQVASPISRTSIPLLSSSPTGAGGLRTPTTPTSSSTSSSSSASTAATSATTTTTTTVTSSPGSSCSAFSSFSPANNAVVIGSTPFPTASTTSQHTSLASSSSPSASLGASSSSQEIMASSNTTASPSSSSSTSTTSTTTSTTTLASSPSPSLFLLHHQQQHPHLFSSSTAALSPKSLTSSTPSPVTVHDFNSGLNVVISSSASANNSTTTNTTINMSATGRKNATPSPISLTPTRALLSPFPPGSPFSPSPIPGNNNNSIQNNGNYKDALQWKDDTSSGTKIKPIPINGHTRETHNTGGGSLTTPPPLSSPLLSLAHHNNMKQNSGKVTSVPTPLSSPSSGQRHDFKRLESLIERRDSESISPLVLIPQHSPATSTTSSLLDFSTDEQQPSKLASLVAEEKPGNKPDNVEEDQTFCISVKLENPAAATEVEEQQCQQQRSNNEDDDSLKVNPSTATKASSSDSGTGEKISMLKSDTGNRDQVDANVVVVAAAIVALGESKEGVKVEMDSPATNDLDSPPIARLSSCDDANKIMACSRNSKTIASNAAAEVGESEVGEEGKNQHGGQAGEGQVDDENYVIVEGNDVPETNTLPVLCPSGDGNNTTQTSNSTDDYFKRSTNASSFKSKDQSTNSLGNVKDVSFTSGYCSSQEDTTCEQQLHNQRIKLGVGKCEKRVKQGKSLMKTKKKGQNMGVEKKVKGKTGLLTEGGKGRGKKKMKESSGGGNDGSFKVATAATLLLPKPTTPPVKPTWSVWKDSLEKRKGKLEGKPTVPSSVKKVKSDFLSFVGGSGPDESKKDKKVKRGKKNIDFVDGSDKLKLPKKRDSSVGVEKGKNKKKGWESLVVKQTPPARKGKMRGKEKTGKESSTKPKKTTKLTTTQQQNQGTSQPMPSWIAPMSPPLTNNYQQQLVINTKSSGDPGGSSNYFISPRNNDTALSSGTSFSMNNSTQPQDLHHQQQQPLSVILSSPTVQSPSQVTFLITSPTQPTGCGGNTSPLRIPAYIPRTGTSTNTTTAVVASTDELVGGEGYNGPATLTLHRDVDALPQQTYYQPPPAITIQYHHSAPATPMTMEAASPSSLDLLATVAQEFGSREDLGKRMSIDGNSSCNASSIGESPPMSPQKSPAIYHPQHYTGSQYTSGTTPSIPAAQSVLKPVKGDVIYPSSQLTVVPTPSAAVVAATAAAGKRPKSPRKQVKTRDKKNAKTANSITLKLSSKKATMNKVGKKEKRTVSDSAFYSPPVVLLKIPQVPGLCNKNKALQKQQQQDKAKKSKEKAKVGDKRVAEVGAISKSKPKSININNSKYNNKDVCGDRGNKNDKPVVLNKKGIPSKEDKNDNGDRLGKKKDERKKNNNNKKAISASAVSPLSSSKSLLLLALPSSTTAIVKSSASTVSAVPVSANNSEKQATKKVKKEKKKNKSEGGTISSSTTTTTAAASSLSLLSPLSIPQKASTQTSDQIITTTASTTTSPTKERCSSGFFNPPERISAFAKQVISRRTSAAAALSPTKPSINSGTTSSCLSPLKQQQQPGSSAVFFPTTQQQQQKSLPNSPTVKMPQLTPYDAAEPTTPTTTTFPKQHSFSAAVAAVASSVIAAMADKRSESSSSVPKMVNAMRFPNSSKNSLSSGSTLPPKLLVPSVSSSSSSRSQDKKDYCDDDDRARYLTGSEQDKKKTDNIVSRLVVNRSPRGSVSKSTASKSEKDNRRLEKKRGKEKADEHQVAVSEVKRTRQSKVFQGGDDDDNDGEKRKRKPRLSRSVTISRVPKITVTQSASSHTPSTSSLAFSPLTPPLTAKLCSIDGEEHRKSAFACLQVPGGSSTPCSSLASRQTSPATNVDDEGGTETENENDLNNVWVADPMFAVSAIKLSNISSAGSSQPTDAEESANDDTDITKDNNRKTEKKGRKDTLPKLSPSYNSKHRLQRTASSSSPQQKRANLLKAKSQLNKTVVHVKPKQLTGNNKKGNRGIKPSTKTAESVVRSRSMEDNDDDEEEEETVDELDLEVANITTQNAPGRKEKARGSNAATSSANTAAASSSGSTPGSNKKRKPSINRNSSSYITNNSSSSSQSKKHHGLSTKEIMTKVFSRKISPELSEKRGKRRRSSALLSNAGTEMDADDEDEDHEDELIGSEPLGKGHSNQQAHQNIAQISMNAAAAAVVVNSNNNGQSSATSSLSASSLALFSLQSPSSSSSSATTTAFMKKPQKRSARSSTTSSSASTKSLNRGNKGQSCSSASVVCGVTSTRASAAAASSSSSGVKDETQLPGKVELDSVEELVDEMRILTDIQGLFYTGRLNALQPPDVYGVTLDNERGAPPHFIFSAEEVLEKCLREKKPRPEGLRPGMRICAYWSPQYSGLYPGRVSSDFSPKFDPDKDLIPIEFDDGDTGMIKLKEIRLLSVNHPVREYDPNPLLTLEKKHRKRRHSSATGTSGGCTGDHEEPDCGEPYCAKIGKLEEDEEDEDDDDDDAGGHHHSSSKMLYWAWSGHGYKSAKSKKKRTREFFRGIQRGDEVIRVGDAALFISNGNERPFIGRVERFWEQKSKKMVSVRWFYHPEEVKQSGKKPSFKYPGALFESPHIDQNDVQTIAKKCQVLPFTEFKQRFDNLSTGSLRVAKLSMKSSSKPREMYYVAGFYDPYTYNLTLNDKVKSAANCSLR